MCSHFVFFAVGTISRFLGILPFFFFFFFSSFFFQLTVVMVGASFEAVVYVVRRTHVWMEYTYTVRGSFFFRFVFAYSRATTNTVAAPSTVPEYF